MNFNTNKKEDINDDQSINYNITEYTRPGVLRCECVPLNRAYFFEVINCWFDLGEFLEDLRKKKCKNSELLQDFQKFGEDNFEFEIECRGIKFYDDEKRKECLEQAKKNWKGTFY